jgi:hypothetical protein
MSDDNQLYAEIRAAQVVAVEKLQQRWGMTADQVAKAAAGLAAPTTPAVTVADTEAMWRRSANDQFRGLGIAPVSDEEAAAIQAAMDAATAAHQSVRALLQPGRYQATRDRPLGGED